MENIDEIKRLANVLNVSDWEWLDVSAAAVEPWATADQKAAFIQLATVKAAQAQELVRLLMADQT